MWEFLRHITGLCGEPHPSLLSMLFATPIFSYIGIKYFKKRNNNKTK